MSSGGWGHNYYEDHFVKENGVWKFKKLHGPFNMYAGYKVGWLDNTVLNTYPEKWPPWPDLRPDGYLSDLSELLHRAVSLSKPGDGQGDAGSEPEGRWRGVWTVGRRFGVCVTGPA